MLILSLKKLGVMTGPLAMIVVGCSLADQELKNIARNYNLIKFAVIKQILLPVLIFFVLRLFCSDDVVWIIVILASMPTAVNLVAFIGERGEDSATAAQAVIVSTLISLPMIPVLLWLMRLF
ncbi:hypothetical protein SDC9_156244 [bioreactor metagenome]|uniref:Membrane transport protein n=1 Tax=bioreactor metagenome TaxID=1076179 RepID=A0A645F5P7_9ZZZZ